MAKAARGKREAVNKHSVTEKPHKKEKARETERTDSKKVHTARQEMKDPMVYRRVSMNQPGLSEKSQKRGPKPTILWPC